MKRFLFLFCLSLFALTLSVSAQPKKPDTVEIKSNGVLKGYLVGDTIIALAPIKAIQIRESNGPAYLTDAFIKARPVFFQVQGWALIYRILTAGRFDYNANDMNTHLQIMNAITSQVPEIKPKE